VLVKTPGAALPLPSTVLLSTCTWNLIVPDTFGATEAITAVRVCAAGYVPVT